jgi:hypothetical protein
VLEVASALVCGELVLDATAEISEIIGGSFRSIAEQLFQFSAGQLDQIPIGRVGRKVTELGAGCFNHCANAC